MAVAGTDLVMVERAGVPYKTTAGEIANLGSGGGVFAPSSSINSSGVKRIGNRNGYGSLSTQAIATGWVYLQPFAPQSIEQVTGAGLEITTSGAGSMILGLYDVTAGDTATLVAATGLIDVSATGFQTANFATPFTPTRSEYLMALATDVFCWARSEATISGLIPLSAGQNRGALYVPRTWDGTLPATLNIGSPAGFRNHTNIAFLTA